MLDNFSVIIESSRAKWDLTPFRFENMWLHHYYFLSIVKSRWVECSVSSREGCRYMKKLKYVKEKLKVWNLEVFRNFRVRKREVLLKLEALDKSESEPGLEEHRIVCKVILRNDLDE